MALTSVSLSAFPDKAWPMNTVLKFYVPTFMLIGMLLAGCAGRVDNRLADDQQTCQTMGHSAGTEAFEQCLAELNKRRCAVVRQGRRQDTRHQQSLDCSRLP